MASRCVGRRRALPTCREGKGTVRSGARRSGAERAPLCRQRGRGRSGRSDRVEGPGGGRARGSSSPVGRWTPAVRLWSSPLSTGRGRWARGRSRAHRRGLGRDAPHHGLWRDHPLERWSGYAGGLGVAGPREAGPRDTQEAPYRCNARLGPAVCGLRPRRGTGLEKQGGDGSGERGAGAQGQCRCGGRTVPGAVCPGEDGTTAGLYAAGTGDSGGCHRHAGRGGAPYSVGPERGCGPRARFGTVG
jgi:hypothetical protein